jgi:hypothetical protein
MLEDLMMACEKEARERKIAFRKFSLQDCQPKGVSDKLEAGHTDTKDATLHARDAMIAKGLRPSAASQDQACWLVTSAAGARSSYADQMGKSLALCFAVRRIEDRKP